MSHPFAAIAFTPSVKAAQRSFYLATVSETGWPCLQLSA